MKKIANPLHWLPFITLLALTTLARGQGAAIYYQTNFPPEEFRARWEKVFDKIGKDAVAVAQGMPAVNGFIYPRQHNEFYYLCGVDTPQSCIVLDGQRRRVTLYLPPRNPQQESAEGCILSASDADLVKKWVGVDEVLSTADMREDKMTAFQTAKTIYTPLQPAEGYAQSRGELRAANRAIAEDYWDGRESREANFKNLLTKRFPDKEIKDLSLVLNDLRGIKSPREIAMLRRASQLAGLGMMEAMRSTKPGVYEYELEGVARYEYIINGARLDGYRSIIGAGTANISNMHYFRNTSEIQNGDSNPHGLRPGLRLLSERHRPRLAPPMAIRALAARVAADRTGLPQRHSPAHPSRCHDLRHPRRSARGDETHPGKNQILQAHLQNSSREAGGGGRRRVFSHRRHGRA